MADKCEFCGKELKPMLIEVTVGDEQIMRFCNITCSSKYWSEKDEEEKHKNRYRTTIF